MLFNILDISWNYAEHTAYAETSQLRERISLSGLPLGKNFLHAFDGSCFL